MILANLARFLPHLIAVAALGGLVWGYGHSRYNAGYNTAESRMQRLVDIAEAHTDQVERAARVTSEVVDREYQTQLSNLDRKYRDAVSRIGPVRVRQCPSSSPVPRVPDAASVDHDAAGGDGLSDEAGDIGPGLVELARLADQQTARLVACQTWIREQATQRAE